MESGARLLFTESGARLLFTFVNSRINLSVSGPFTVVMLQNERKEHEDVFYLLFLAKFNFLVSITKPFTFYMHEETYETGFRNQNYFLNFRVGT